MRRIGKPSNRAREVELPSTFPGSGASGMAAFAASRAAVGVWLQPWIPRTNRHPSKMPHQHGLPRRTARFAFKTESLHFQENKIAQCVIAASNKKISQYGPR